MKGKQKKKKTKQPAPNTLYFLISVYFLALATSKKRQSRATTRKTFVLEFQARHKPKPTENLMGKGFCKVSTLKNLSPSFESSGGSRPSIINHRFIIIFKKVHLKKKRSIFTSSTLLLWGICFPKYIAPNVTISEKHRLL